MVRADNDNDDNKSDDIRRAGVVSLIRADRSPSLVVVKTTHLSHMTMNLRLRRTPLRGAVPIKPELVHGSIVHQPSSQGDVHQEPLSQTCINFSLQLGLEPLRLLVVRHFPQI